MNLQNYGITALWHSTRNFLRKWKIITKAKLKKHLQSLPKEQVIEVVLELYDARKEAKDYLEFYLDPDSDAELEKCKKAIEQEFFSTPVGFSRIY